MCLLYPPYRIRYMIFALYEKKLMMSIRIVQEIKAIWEGLSFEINDCIQDVDA